MQMIASHMERAFLVRDLLSEDRTLSELLGSVMARAGFGLILATADRRIVYVNDAADTLMRASNGLHCERNCISAGDFTTSRKLQSLITAASRQTDESAQGGSLIFRDEDGVASLVVHVVPLCPRTAVVPPGREYPVAGLIMVDCQRGIADRINVFADLWLDFGGSARRLPTGLGKRPHEGSVPTEYCPIHGAVPSHKYFGKDWQPPPGGACPSFLRSNNPLVWTPPRGGKESRGCRTWFACQRLRAGHRALRALPRKRRFIFPANRTKKFHVKHFGAIARTRAGFEQSFLATPATFVSAYSCYTGRHAGQ